MEPLNSSSLGAMGFLLMNLNDNELLHTDDNAKQLIVDLRTMCTRMKEISEVHDPSPTMKYWINDARELSYDMEVCVNQFIHASQPDAVSWIKEILGFKDRVREVNERCDRYNLLNKYVPSSPTKIVVSHHLQTMFEGPEIVDNPISMEDHTKKLLEWMRPKGASEGDFKFKVVSILGDGGIGKSTLVKTLWRQSEGMFDRRAFVQTAKKPDTRMILRSILSQVCPKQQPMPCKVPKLIEDLRRHLQDKRYFIVIDDLWDVSVWHIVRRAFPGSNYRIITTTAVEKVAQACCSYDCNNVVNVKRLHEEQPKKLFLAKAFASEKGCPQQVNDVIDEITRKCGGLPLAIICTARLVACQPETEQEKHLDYVNNFLSDHLGTNTASVEILNQVLNLCYNSLPRCLKSCLLYLSIYPENYSILKEDLVKQWIAEDFICTPEGKDIVEVASSYFGELLNLGLIQRMDIIDCNKKGMLSYTVHPVVFEFITCKSMEDNFVTIIDYSHSTPVLTERIRRLSLHFGSATYATIPKSVELSQVRSLAFMGLLDCIPLLVEFKLVRVMILHLHGDDEDTRFSLKEIRELGLLIYLQVRCNVTVELPGQVRCLKHLKTLEINAGVTDVPSDIVHHSTLQYVRIGKKTEYKYLAQGPVSIIQYGLSNEHLPAVEVLDLQPPICILPRLPGWIGKLTSLRILEVVVTQLGRYELDHLGKLPVLTVLSLYVRKKPDRAGVTFHTDAPFPALEYFKLVSGVLRLTFPNKGMPNLLRIKICFNVHSGDDYKDMLGGIKHLLRLKEVVASIGVATGAEETDCIAAESALQDTIGKHPSEPKFVKGKRLVDPVDEEYEPPPEIEEIQEIESSHIHTQKEGLPIKQPATSAELPTPDSSGIRPPPAGDKDLDASQLPEWLAAWRQSQNKIWRRAGPTINPGVMVGTFFILVHQLLEKLQELQQQEHVLHPEISRKIIALQMELQEAMLYMTDPYDPLKHRNYFSDRVRKLFYDIEDWADLFSLRSTSHGQSNPFSSRLFGWIYHALEVPMLLATRHAMIKELKDFRDRVRKLRIEWHWHYSRFQDVDALSIALPIRRHSFVAQKPWRNLISYERPVEEVIKMLKNVTDKVELKVISIVGMAGTGKTTLAESVYECLRGEFGTSIFISVEQYRDMARLGSTLWTIQMAHQLGEVMSLPAGMELQGSEDYIGSQLGELLKEKNRYLVVVDDLWTWEHWESIKYLFPENNLHSRIIITTRNDALASHCSSGSSDCIYKIGLLSEANSEQLFLSEVFGAEHGCPHNLKSISTQIIKKCGGLPLALVSVADMLRGQSEREWRKIESNMLLNQDGNYLFQRLNLSYNDLPPNLKICMLYLSIFPEYYEIDVEHLVRLWIAEGFIVKESGITMEETARSYLDGLISRNLIQPLQVNHDDIPKCCMVHPVIHDFIIYKSCGQQFVTVVNDQTQRITMDSGKIRRLSLQSKSKQGNMGHIYSDFFTNAHSVIVIGHAITGLHLSNLRKVRILDLEGCDGPVCLDDLENPQLLRYLRLKGTDVSELPETIGELSCLQTLDVGSTNVKKLPPSIINLEKLVHLLCGSARLPCGISKMKALQTLSCAIVMNSSKDTSIIQELSELIDLRELELFYDFTEMPWNDRVAKFPRYEFRRLKKLRIQCSSGSVAFEPGVLKRVEILELRFDGLLDKKSTALSGIEHLLSLKHVLLEFSQDDAAAMATVDAVRNAAATVHPNHPEVTVNVDGRPQGSTIA